MSIEAWEPTLELSFKAPPRKSREAADDQLLDARSLGVLTYIVTQLRGTGGLPVPLSGLLDRFHSIGDGDVRVLVFHLLESGYISIASEEDE